jgi:hypothetical protein
VQRVVALVCCIAGFRGRRRKSHLNSGATTRLPSRHRGIPGATHRRPTTHQPQAAAALVPNQTASCAQKLL